MPLSPNDPAFSESRTTLRAELIRRRKALDPADRERRSAIIQRRVLDLPEWRDADTVALYVAARNEVSTAQLLERAWAEGKRVLLPRCLPPDAGEGIMDFVLCRGYDELEPGALPGPAARGVGAGRRPHRAFLARRVPTATAS